MLKKAADALPELTEDLSSTLQLQADRLSGSALHQWDETLERLREALTAGVEAANAQRQAIQAARNDTP
jgi:gas vesicle protein